MGHLDKTWEKLKNVILKYVLHLENRGYTIPINDKNNELYTQNKFINASIFIADLFCIIITLLGLSQQLLTFIGVITYCIYTLCDQVKILIKQEECKKNTSNCGYFLYKNKKTSYPPNIKYVGIILIIFFTLAALALNMVFCGETHTNFYYFVIICSFVILFKIKVEFMIYDTLGISEWDFIVW